MAKKIVGNVGNVGKTTTSNIKALKDAISKELAKPKPKPVSREDFASDEEWNAFLLFTKPIPLQKRVNVPFKTLGEYLNEYNLIMSKQSQLNATQRILIKNVIHAEVRKGTIMLIKG